MRVATANAKSLCILLVLLELALDGYGCQWPAVEMDRSLKSRSETVKVVALQATIMHLYNLTHSPAHGYTLECATQAKLAQAVRGRPSNIRTRVAALAV